MLALSLLVEEDAAVHVLPQCLRVLVNGGYDFVHVDPAVQYSLLDLAQIADVRVVVQSDAYGNQSVLASHREDAGIQY